MTDGDELTSDDICDYRRHREPAADRLHPRVPTLEDGSPRRQLDLDAIGHYYVAGDGRANENVMLTSIHTIWARNHNFWVDRSRPRPAVAWTEAEYFEAARMMNVTEYQRVVFTEFANAMAGGLVDGDDEPDLEHGFEAYDPTVDASISVEFAQAAYRFGHSMLNETVAYVDEAGRAAANVAGAGVPAATDRQLRSASTRCSAARSRWPTRPSTSTWSTRCATSSSAGRSTSPR